MGKTRDLSEFERGTIVGARRAGSSISKTADLLGFSRTTISRVYREWCHSHKTSSQRQSCGRKRLVDGTGERIIERLVEENSRATTLQIRAQYNSSGVEKPISLRTTRRTLKRLGFSFENPRLGSSTLQTLEAEATDTSLLPVPGIAAGVQPEIMQNTDCGQNNGNT